MSEWILVSGATSGVGLELSKSLIKHGYCVYAIGRDHNKYSSTLFKWSKENSFEQSVNWLTFDFSSPDCISKIEFKDLPKLSGFVNCAGVLPISPIKLESFENIVNTININLVSPILLTKELLRSARIEKRGSVIFISSISGLKVGSKGHSLYSASKAGIAGFVLSLANECSSSQIRVNSIAPGILDTPMLLKTKNLIGEDQFSQYAKQYPLGLGTPLSIIPMIQFLLGDQSAWITGQNFVIDGGFTLN